MLGVWFSKIRASWQESIPHRHKIRRIMAKERYRSVYSCTGIYSVQCYLYVHRYIVLVLETDVWEVEKNGGYC